ncbi:MAG: YqgE/AlgH family protein [Desulfobacterales bacterium]|jgi:putative transcriptional regulator
MRNKSGIDFQKKHCDRTYDFHDSKKGAVRLNPATQKNTKILKLSVHRFILALLILPAVIIVSASFVAATPVRNADDQKLSAFSRDAAVQAKSQKELAQGKFLVAGRQLMDPNFRETVVLLIRYGTDGAIGLVINRPVKLKLSTVLPDIKELERTKETLYLGGPVEPARVMLLVRSGKPPEASMPVFGDVYLSSSQKVLHNLIKKPVKEERFRIYAGYAGWAPKQLESELDRGHWHVLKADAETLFDKKSSEIWQELIQRVSVKWVRTINSGELLDQAGNP